MIFDMPERYKEIIGGKSSFLLFCKITGPYRPICNSIQALLHQPDPVCLFKIKLFMIMKMTIIRFKILATATEYSP